MPYFIHAPDMKHIYLAGLWERWNSPTGETIETCTIITTSANEALKNLHDRMPVIVPRESASLWVILGDLDLLLSQTAVQLTATAVSPLVNSPKNDLEACLAPLKAAG